MKPEEVPSKDKKWTKRSMLGRRRSTGRSDAPIETPTKFDPSIPPPLNRTKIGPDQAAKIQAAAMSLRQQQAQLENQLRHPTGSQRSSQRTNSVFTLQPVILSEATPAMKWASKYDRDAIRDAYLNNLPLQDGPSRPATERSLPALPTEDADEEREESRRPRPVSLMPPPPPPMSKSEPPSKPGPIHESDSKPAPISKVTPIMPSPTFSPMNHPALLPPSPSTNGRVSPALQSPPLSPPGQKSRGSNGSTPEKVKKTNRFKSFFSSKKAEPVAPGRLTPQPIENSSNASLTLPNPNLGRRLSTQKKRNAPATLQGTVASSSQAQLAPAASARPQRHESGSSNPGSEEVRVATQAFSSFDQGPLDAPAFIPGDSPDITEPSSPTVETRPAVPGKDDSASVSEESAPGSPAEAMPVQDRWAQIRKNAAERAKVVPKASEEPDARGSMDDGETSGEETIESRVARIKARVAELTGNMEANKV